MSSQKRKVPHHSTEPFITATHETGKILYPEAEKLNRPLLPPASLMEGARKYVIAAIVIAVLILAWYIYSSIAAPAREQDNLEENLSRDVPLQLPSLVSLMPLDDNAIIQSLSDQGFTVFQSTPPGATADGSFELVKLPEGVTVEEAAAYYLTGVDNLGSADLARLLNGSWFMSVYRNPTAIRVRYADFHSANVEEAINAAMTAEGIDEKLLTEAGVDDVGNTYRTGLVVSNGSTYTWRVSALPLSEVYNAPGFPSNAFYVGIRFTA